MEENVNYIFEIILSSPVKYRECLCFCDKTEFFLHIHAFSVQKILDKVSHKRYNNAIEMPGG